MTRTRFDTMSPYKYPFYVCLHPHDGFLEMKANKKASPVVAIIIALAWLFVELFYRSAADYDMNSYSMEDTSLLRTGVMTVMMYVMVCLANWCFCTLLDGKGKMKDICVVASCALLPYVITRFLCTLGSWILAGDEQVFLNYAVTISIVWGLIIAFLGLQEFHEYSFKKTALSIFLTIVGLIIIVFLMLLVVSLFQQLYFFVSLVIYEIRF